LTPGGRRRRRVPCSGGPQVRRRGTGRSHCNRGAGTPKTTLPGGTSRVTTDPAPTSAPAPITMPATIVEPEPTLQPSSKRGGANLGGRSGSRQTSSLSLMVRTPAPRKTRSAYGPSVFARRRGAVSPRSRACWPGSTPWSRECCWSACRSCLRSPRTASDRRMAGQTVGLPHRPNVHATARGGPENRGALGGQGNAEA
jgi:hypothetical protein